LSVRKIRVDFMQEKTSPRFRVRISRISESGAMPWRGDRFGSRAALATTLAARPLYPRLLTILSRRSTRQPWARNIHDGRPRIVEKWSGDLQHLFRMMLGSA
jgi:hypothetical protein